MCNAHRARSLSMELSTVSIVLGTGGMAVSVLFLACTAVQDVLAGMAGFGAGAVLVGAGVVAMALAAQRTGDTFVAPRRASR